MDGYNLNFINGIVSRSTDELLQFTDNEYNKIKILSGQTVTLSVSQHKSNYIVQVDDSNELEWDLSSGYGWLYVDIDTLSGEIASGVSDKRFNYGLNFPNNPENNEYFFNTKEHAGYYWSGSKWIQCNRVALAFSNKKTIRNHFIGTHVGIRGIQFPHKPLNGNNGVIVGGSGKAEIDNKINKPKTILPEHLNLSLNNHTIPENVAVINIPKFTCVTNTTHGVDICSSGSVCAGIVIKSYHVGDTVQIFNNQIINTGLKFSHEKVNTALFVDNNGELTTTPTSANTVQRVGYVVSKYLIYISVNKIINFK